MAEKKITGIIWLVVGIIILVLSLVADSVGLGKDPGIGYKQVAGTMAGAIVFVVGLVMILYNIAGIHKVSLLALSLYNIAGIHKVSLLALSLVVSLAIGELAVRLMGFSPNPAVVNPHFSGDSWALEDSDLGWMNRQGTFRSIEAGKAEMTFLAGGRRASRKGDPTNARHLVYVVGGSYMQGYGIPDNETFAYRLDAAHEDVRVDNYGTGGYGTYQSMLLVDRLTAEQEPTQRPDLVLYGLMGHHLVRNVAVLNWARSLTDSRGNNMVPPHVTLIDGSLQRHPMSLLRRWPLEGTMATVALLHDIFLQFEFRGREEMALEATKLLLMQFSRLAEERGFRFLIVLIEGVPAAIAEYAKTEKLQYIDCQNPRDPNRGGHPNGKTNALWAECIETWLEAELY